MKTIEVGPSEAKTMNELQWFKTEDGFQWDLGQNVWLCHADGSRIKGTIDKFYGVGRIAGANIQGRFLGVAGLGFSFVSPSEDVWLESVEEEG